MKKSDIKIENLLPSPSSFKLSMFEDFEFKLKPCTGGMLMDISKKIGNIEGLLSNPSAENVSKIAIMLMEYDSAVKFKKQTVKTIDTLTGDESEVDVGGYVLLTHSIQGLNEQFSIYAAVLISIGYEATQAEEVVSRLKDTINGVVNDNIDNALKKKTPTKKQ